MNQHFRIALLVEGEEEEDYWRRLQNLGLILDEKRLTVINAKSINKIPARFHEKYASGRYYAIFVFCDTDHGYAEIKQVVENTVGEGAAAELVFFASPCSMTILLAHFSKDELVTTKTVNKKKNGALVKDLGVTFDGDYNAKEEQRSAIMKQINRQNYQRMKELISSLPQVDTQTPSTNILRLLSMIEIGGMDNLDSCLQRLNDIENKDNES